mmetsp:Transcript_5638/g.35012  ORF Transcript_5638/g.35012 Transcript_5638/m.35012 type:complete len:210 (-) Transcript_5638:1345-1974(-)
MPNTTKDCAWHAVQAWRVVGGRGTWRDRIPRQDILYEQRSCYQAGFDHSAICACSSARSKDGILRWRVRRCSTYNLCTGPGFGSRLLSTWWPASPAGRDVQKKRGHELRGISPLDRCSVWLFKAGGQQTSVFVRLGSWPHDVAERQYHVRIVQACHGHPGVRRAPKLSVRMLSRRDGRCYKGRISGALPCIGLWGEGMLGSAAPRCRSE